MTNQNLIIFSALFVILLLAILNWNNIRRFSQEWHTRRCLNLIGIKQRRNIVCPDGLDGEFVLDRLIMLPKAILLVSFKRYPGNIYCAEKISEWTQVIEQKSYKFENPLFDLEIQLTALKEIIPGVTVKGFLFFDHTAQFPKGHPDNVLQPTNIPEEFLQANCAEPEQSILSAWERLAELPVNSGANRPLRLKT